MEGVIKSIQGLSASPGDLSSLHRLLKGAEETLRSESDLQICTLDQLDASKHSLGYLYLLLVSVSPSAILHQLRGASRAGEQSRMVRYMLLSTRKMEWSDSWNVKKTVFEHFEEDRYRLFAVDLLGFGESPKPRDSLYTLRDHVETIERSVIKPYQLGSFHVVAHSMGCLIALALAAKHSTIVKSVTLVAPPYFPSSLEESVLTRIAGKRLWPPLAFGTAVMSWYEHVGTAVPSWMQFVHDFHQHPFLCHFSLLLGCALPIWMSSGFNDRALSPFAGILSLGIGDTMASMVGHKYGVLRWSKTGKKMVEGTAAGITSMMAVCYVLVPVVASMGYILSQGWWSLLVAVTATGMLEAYTVQLDNAFIPLVFYSLLCL
ncbi:unnamed protein product [Eruca vesicaria subsp. sativa]|uniref:dolichol kinase n=1 Tax=Eruca vesicaria subsp. sativa TaxID=29727 RepID=A0ABC8L4H7_ERUVS|nr:unnamed protein product [Eruca vesicaria subsp. sativa]